MFVKQLSIVHKSSTNPGRMKWGDEIGGVWLLVGGQLIKPAKGTELPKGRKKPLAHAWFRRLDPEEYEAIVIRGLQCNVGLSD